SVCGSCLLLLWVLFSVRSALGQYLRQMEFWSACAHGVGWEMHSIADVDPISPSRRGNESRALRRNSGRDCYLAVAKETAHRRQNRRDGCRAPISDSVTHEYKVIAQ